MVALCPPGGFTREAAEKPLFILLIYSFLEMINIGFFGHLNRNVTHYVLLVASVGKPWGSHSNRMGFIYNYIFYPLFNFWRGGG